MDQGHDSPTEQGKVAFEFAGPADTGFHLAGVGIPEGAVVWGKQWSTASVEVAAPCTLPRADQLQQFPMGKFPIGGNPQLQTGQLGRVEIQGDDPSGPFGQHGQGVVPGRSDGKAGVTGLDLQPFQENIGILPALGVADG